MAKSENFLTVGQAITLLEAAGYRVENHGNKNYMITDPAPGGTRMLRLAGLRVLARTVRASYVALHNMQQNGLTTSHPGATIYP